MIKEQCPHLERVGQSALRLISQAILSLNFILLLVFIWSYTFIRLNRTNIDLITRQASSYRNRNIYTSKSCHKICQLSSFSHQYNGIPQLFILSLWRFSRYLRICPWSSGSLGLLTGFSGQVSECLKLSVSSHPSYTQLVSPANIRLYLPLKARIPSFQKNNSFCWWLLSPWR